MIKNFQNQVMRASKLLAAGTVCALWFSTGAQAQSDNSFTLTPYKASYIAYKWGDDVGEAHIELSELSDNQYSLLYTSKVSKFFLSDKRSEHSIFTLNDSTVEPSQYFYNRSGTGPDKELVVTFGQQGGEKIVVENGDIYNWNGEFDNQIYRLDLAKQLAKGVTELDYSFVNYRGELRNYGVKVIETETLTLPYGKLDAVKVKLIRDSKKRETYAWFAPSLDYALVRLQQFKDGDEQGDIKLKSFQPE